MIKEIGKYAIVRELAAGATAKVYLAIDTFTNQEVALKLIDQDMLKSKSIGRAQQKGLCPKRFTPEAAAGFLLSALNGILIEHLFLQNSPLDPENAVAMVSSWLFGDDSHPNSNGGTPAA